MMVVSDIEDVFVPLVDGFLVSPQEARSVVDRYVLIFLVSFSQCLYQLVKESEAMPCIFFFWHCTIYYLLYFLALCNL